MRGLVIVAAVVCACALPGAQAARKLARGDTEVVVTLKRPPLAETRGNGKLLAAGQAIVERRIERSIPGARVRWRYRHVLDGLAVVLPARDVGRLGSIAGVEAVYPGVRYAPALDQSPEI